MFSSSNSKISQSPLLRRNGTPISKSNSKSIVRATSQSVPDVMSKQNAIKDILKNYSSTSEAIEKIIGADSTLKKQACSIFQPKHTRGEIFGLLSLMEREGHTEFTIATLSEFLKINGEMNEENLQSYNNLTTEKYISEFKNQDSYKSYFSSRITKGTHYHIKELRASNTELTKQIIQQKFIDINGQTSFRTLKQLEILLVNNSKLFTNEEISNLVISFIYTCLEAKLAFPEKIEVYSIILKYNGIKILSTDEYRVCIIKLLDECFDSSDKKSLIESENIYKMLIKNKDWLKLEKYKDKLSSYLTAYLKHNYIKSNIFIHFSNEIGNDQINNIFLNTKNSLTKLQMLDMCFLNIDVLNITNSLDNKEISFDKLIEIKLKLETEAAKHKLDVAKPYELSDDIYKNNLIESIIKVNTILLSVMAKHLKEKKIGIEEYQRVIGILIEKMPTKKAIDLRKKAYIDFDIYPDFEHKGELSAGKTYSGNLMGCAPSLFDKLGKLTRRPFSRNYLLDKDIESFIFEETSYLTELIKGDKFSKTQKMLFHLSRSYLSQSVEALSLLFDDSSNLNTRFHELFTPVDSYLKHEAAARNFYFERALSELQRQGIKFRSTSITQVRELFVNEKYSWL